MQARSRGYPKIERVSSGRARAYLNLSGTTGLVRSDIFPSRTFLIDTGKLSPTDGQPVDNPDIFPSPTRAHLPRRQHCFARRAAVRLALRRAPEYALAPASADDGPVR
jgi:hypothetical protein